MLKLNNYLNLITMKKLIYTIGIVSVNLMLLGALLKVLHLAGGSSLLFISITIFCFGFLPLALISSYKSQIERNYRWLYVVTFIVFSVVLMGSLFKILHWPYAGVLMLIGIPLPYVLFLPVYLYQTRKNKGNSLLNNLGVMFGLTFIAIFSVLLTLNVSSNVLDNFALNSFNNENSVRFHQSTAKNYADKDNIKQKSDELCAYIDELKCEILIATNNNTCTNGKFKMEDNPSYLFSLDNKSTRVSIGFDDEGQSKIEVMKTLITEYRIIISKQERLSKELKELANNLLEIDEKEFPSNHLTLILDVLTRIQSNVRFVEVEYLSSL